MCVCVSIERSGWKTEEKQVKYLNCQRNSDVNQANINNKTGETKGDVSTKTGICTCISITLINQTLIKKQIHKIEAAALKRKTNKT